MNKSMRFIIYLCFMIYPTNFYPSHSLPLPDRWRRHSPVWCWTDAQRSPSVGKTHPCAVCFLFGCPAFRCKHDYIDHKDTCKQKHGYTCSSSITSFFVWNGLFFMKSKQKWKKHHETMIGGCISTHPPWYGQSRRIPGVAHAGWWYPHDQCCYHRWSSPNCPAPISHSPRSGSESH